MKNKKYTFSLIIFLVILISFLAILLPYLKIKQTTQISNNQIVLKKEKSRSRWDTFTKFEYINYILNTIYPTKNDANAKQKYIEEQRKLDENNYFNTAKEALFYVNNIFSSYRHNADSDPQKEPYAWKYHKQVIHDLFSKNWLWTLFNIDRFIYAIYNENDHIQNNITGDQTQKNSLEFGAFRKLKSNEFSQYTIQEDSDNKIVVHLLSSNNIIFKVNIDKGTKTVDVYNYIYIYPELAKNTTESKSFDFDKYIEASIITYKDNLKSDKAKFDELYGGKPLSLTVVDIE
ncbi:aromatic motif membrane protein [Mycoplasma sp. 06067-C1-B144P-99-0482-3]|uniref:aromatic motif membrane protein n=1 Tax=Mycoplasma sp. 06067-C1-B144P-99-0482-3 TaxID=3117438 RepID=UPI003DA43C5E